jgi:recombinational DNA repair ATPase RecF
MSQPPGDEASHAPRDVALEPVRLIVRDYRGLREVDWTIEPGVSLLVGPNGSGKTSVLSALGFLREAYDGGVAQAVRWSRSASALRRLGAKQMQQ